MEDRDIVELIYNREEIGLSKLKAKYHELLLALSMSILHSELDSDECVSDTYLKVWKNIPPYKPYYLKSFITKITRQLSIDKYRINAKIRDNEQSVEDFECIVTGSSKIDDDFFQTELEKTINRFLRKMDITTQILFIRRYFLGESVKELSLKFDLSENVISVKLNRARKKLKVYLEKEGYRIEEN